MKFELSFERVYPQPHDAVWRALTDPTALGEWLMETDFAPEIGRQFEMWCDDGVGGRDTYVCTLLEYEPPNRMLWSWVLDGQQSQGDTYVEFKVEPVPQGTKVSITHKGDRDRQTVDKFEGGWPHKMDQLGLIVSKAASS